MLIKGASLLHDGGLQRDRDLLIEGNRIAEIGRDLRPDRDEDVIDAQGKLAISGMINGHTHLAMTLFRGYADDMELMPWLQEKIWPMEAKLKAEDIRWGVKLGCLELIRLGITCYNDMYYFMDDTAEVTREMGLRAFLCEVLFDSRLEPLEEAEGFIGRWKEDELICPALGPHAVYTCSEETLLRSRDIAEKNDVMLHIHLSETRGEVEDFKKAKGISPVEYLDSLGMLSDRMTAAHCVWLSEKDMEILARRRVNVVDCTVSNLKLASGIAPLERLVEAGANVCLGTDGASSNNNMSLFQEMKATAIVQKNATGRPSSLPADKVWQMATNNAYRAFGLNMGIREGALADLALVDLKKPWFRPLTNIISHLVYSMTGGVDTTIVNGKVLMEGGVIPGEEEILDRAQERFEDLVTRE